MTRPLPDRDVRIALRPGVWRVWLEGPTGATVRQFYAREAVARRCWSAWRRRYGPRWLVTLGPVEGIGRRTCRWCTGTDDQPRAYFGA